MSNASDIKIICLWESEVKLAAKALRRAYELNDKPDSTEDERTEALRAAFNACWAALYHASLDTADDAVFVMGAKPFKFPPTKTKKMIACLRGTRKAAGR